MRTASFLLALSISLLGLHSAHAFDCQEITAAIEAYEKGQLDKAISLLQCRIDRDSRDYLARKILSDIYWGENQIEKSIEVAQSLESLPETPARNQIRAQLRKRISPLRASFRSELVSGSGETVADGAIGLSYRYSGKNHLSLNAERTSIVLTPNATRPVSRLTDTFLRLGGFGSIGRFMYLETVVGIAPSYSFLPKGVASATPHYVFSDGSDVWLGLQWRGFDQRTAFDFSGGWIVPVARSVFIDSAVQLTASDGLLPQIGSTLVYIAQDGWEIRAGVAGGRTIETPALDANFWESHLNLAHPLGVALAIRGGFSLHRSKERHEQRLTLGFDWLF